MKKKIKIPVDAWIFTTLDISHRAFLSITEQAARTMRHYGAESSFVSASLVPHKDFVIVVDVPRGASVHLEFALYGARLMNCITEYQAHRQRY